LQHDVPVCPARSCGGFTTVLNPEGGVTVFIIFKDSRIKTASGPAIPACDAKSQTLLLLLRAANRVQPGHEASNALTEPCRAAMASPESHHGSLKADRPSPGGSKPEEKKKTKKTLNARAGS